MNDLWIFHVAFVLGLNPYSKLCSRNVFHVFGSVFLLYISILGFYMTYVFISLKVSSLLILSVFYRNVFTGYLIFKGVSDYDLSLKFYDEMFLGFKISDSQKKYFKKVSSFILLLTCGLLLECLYIVKKVGFEDGAFFLSAFLNVVTPQVTMYQFVLCCTVIQGLYIHLQEDISKTPSYIAAFTIRRVRARETAISDLVKNMNKHFGVKVMFYFLAVQFIMLQKADLIIHKLVQKNYDFIFVASAITLVVHLLALWLYCFCVWRTTQMHEEVLSTLLSLPTRNMDEAALEEIVLFAEELQHRPTRFSAAGCFYVGLHTFYSVVGISISYLIIVGPLAIQNKYNIS